MNASPPNYGPELDFPSLISAINDQVCPDLASALAAIQSTAQGLQSNNQQISQDVYDTLTQLAVSIAVSAPPPFLGGKYKLQGKKSARSLTKGSLFMLLFRTPQTPLVLTLRPPFTASSARVRPVAVSARSVPSPRLLLGPEAPLSP